MKRKLLFAALCVVSALGFKANAQVEPENNGIYYLYNEEAGLFLTRGNNWGTQAVGRPVALPWKITIADGKYKLQMYDLTVAGSTTGFGSNCFTDNGSPLLFTPNGNATNGYTLQNGSNYITVGEEVSLSTTATAWKFLTQAQYDAVLDAKVAAQESAIATTKGITIPDGQSLNDVVTNASEWAADATVNDGVPTSGNWTATKHKDRGGSCNWNVSYGTEMYQCGDGHYTRTITGLKKGIYKVSIRGMKRMGYNDICTTMGNAGYPVSDTYMTANGNVIRFKAWYEDRVNDSNPNSTGDFVNIVNNGGYITEGFTYVGDDGKLVLDASSEAYWGGSWFLFNGISYTFYNNEVSDEDATAIIATATALESEIMQASVSSALSSAKTTFNGARTIANYNALSTAIANANASKNAYANAKSYFDEAKPILDNTNVYTASAYATYYTEPKAKYDARTLTTEEGNALKKLGAWHDTNTLDDILLSSWTIGGTQCKDYDTALYINTWSIEGNTDGSEFYTPFFEYWTGDGNSLGANNIVATVTDLLPNTTYSFTIRARVRQTDNKTKIANGITMKVGDGEPVDISAGAIFNTGPFFIGNFTAVGETDADGKMTMTMTVAENSNISWLSFYNAKYTEGEDLSAYIADYEFALANVNTALTNDVAYVAMQTDLQDAATTYAKGEVDETSKTALIAAKEALESALITYNATVAPLKGNDISQWTTTGNNGSFQVNTWSSEGASDGSGMLTPFIQNWIGKGTSLTDATMSYTINGLTPGYYKVTALVRSLNEAGGATPQGTFIFANDAIERAYGTNSSACTNGVYGNPVAYGLVGDDGKLTIGIKVIKANINWVSWKNFVYTYEGATLTQAIADNLTGEARTFENAGADAAVAQANAISALSTLSNANYVAAGQAIEAAYKAIDRDFTALKAALAAADAGTAGFEVGEFAPYNVAPAQAIDQTSEANTQAEINAAAAACVANATEVEAVYNPTFALSENDGAMTGWETDNAAGLGGAYHARAFVLTSGMTNYDNLAAFGQGDGTRSCAYFRFDGTNSVKNTIYTYGATDGYTIPLKAKVYELKAQVGGWGQVDKDITMSVVTADNTLTVATQTVHTPSTGVNAGGDVIDFDLVFEIPSAGDYKILLQNGNTSVDQAVVVSNFSFLSVPAQTVTISAAGFATLYNAYALDFEHATPAGLTAYTADLDGETVTLTAVNNVPAETGVVLKGAVGTYSIPVIASSETAKGDLTGSVSAATAHDAYVGEGYYIYGLALNGGQAQFTKVTSGSVAPGKAFLKVSTAVSSKSLRAVVPGQPTEVTAPEVVETEEPEVLFNMAGIPVGKDFKGYVINQKGEKRLQR